MVAEMALYFGFAIVITTQRYQRWVGGGVEGGKMRIICGSDDNGSWWVAKLVRPCVCVDASLLFSPRWPICFGNGITLTKDLGNGDIGAALWLQLYRLPPRCPTLVGDRVECDNGAWRRRNWYGLVAEGVSFSAPLTNIDWQRSWKL